MEYEKPDTTCCYDADVSSCSTDFNVSHEDSHQFEPDGGIGQDHEEENMDSNHCLYDEDAVATCSSTKSALLSPTVSTRQSRTSVGKRLFLETPSNRAISPHSLDSWICYSNSSDEFTCSSHDYILNKSSKINLDDGNEEHENEYDKISFVNNKLLASSSNKKSKIVKYDETETVQNGSRRASFNFSSPASSNSIGDSHFSNVLNLCSDEESDPVSSFLEFIE